jgi:SAM-dependent methyltransferase
MAVDFNTVKFLLWARNLGVKFGRTATLGHLGFDCLPGALRGAARNFGVPATDEQVRRCFARESCQDAFADEFFRFLGAGEVVSIDYSDYEQATFLHDLNLPFPAVMQQSFDLVFDGGTLEHVFNYSAALKHTLELVKPGGHFVTVTPANGLMGHGFFQLSPELFFSVFNGDNGFVLRKIVLFEMLVKDAPFYEVQNPATAGVRVELNESPPVFLAVLAQRQAVVPIFAKPPLQSDYVAAWARPATTIDQSTPVGRIRVALNPYWPPWLRNLKRRLAPRKGERPSLHNRKSFRPIGYQELTSERG